MMRGHGHIRIGRFQRLAELSAFAERGFCEVDMVEIGASWGILSLRNRNEAEQSKQQGTSAFQCFLQIFGLI